jgi:hypothetical protein
MLKGVLGKPLGEGGGQFNASVKPKPDAGVAK